MKTAYYTLTTQNILALDESLKKASGEECRVTWVRQPEQPVRRGGNNVVELAAWKAAREREALETARWMDEGPDEWADEEELDRLAEAYEVPAAPARRPRREHPALPLLELAATLSVVGAAAALIFRVLAF